MEYIFDPERPPTVIVDAGCSTGVSTVELKALFPSAHMIYGVDIQGFPETDHFGNTAEGVSLMLDNTGRFKSEDFRTVRYLRGDYYQKLFQDGTVDLFLILNSHSLRHHDNHTLDRNIKLFASSLQNTLSALNPDRGKLVLGINSVGALSDAKVIVDVMIFERNGDSIELIGDPELYEDCSFDYETKKKIEHQLNIGITSSL